MHISLSLSVSLILASSVLAEKVQNPGLTVPQEYTHYHDTVVEMFRDSYETYRKQAWGHDAVAPLSQTGRDDLNGWGATIVDAMSTVHVMGLMDYFDEAVKFVGTIDYSVSKTNSAVSLFETTIRHLAGLISAYELSGQTHDVLLEKAIQVADKLAYGWVDGSDIPFGHLIFKPDGPSVPEDPWANSNIAEAGILVLEWGLLSKYSGNKTYEELAAKALHRIMNNPAPLPGMPAQVIDPRTGNPINGYVTWGGGSDPYPEVSEQFLATLFCFPSLNCLPDNSLVGLWHRTVDTTIATLLRRSTVGNWLYTADRDSRDRIRHVGSHLACFHGGNFILGGKMINNATIVDIGLELADSCFNTYQGTASGKGPEVFAFISDDRDFTGGQPLAEEQTAFYNEHGFYTRIGYNVLRPEVLESKFYAWRTTGDTKYLDRVVEAMESFRKWLRASRSAPDATGYAGIHDMNNPTESSQFDDTASFWFSEVMKYLYLTFDDPDHISIDDYVFNTKCHLFKAPSSKDRYGSGSPAPLDHTPFRIQEGSVPTVSPVADVTAAITQGPFLMQDPGSIQEVVFRATKSVRSSSAGPESIFWSQGRL